MLIGVAQQQFVKPRLQLHDAFVQRGSRPTGEAPAKAEYRLLTADLALQLVAAVLFFLQQQTRLRQLRLGLLQAREIILVVARHHADVLALELLEPLFRLHQSRLVLPDLLRKESLGRIGIAPAFTQGGLDEDRQQRLNNALGMLRVLVGVGDGVQVVVPPARTLEFDVAAESIDDAVKVFGCPRLDVQIGHPGDLLQIRAAQQCLRHDVHAIIDIGLHREPLHQGPQLGVGIDEHAGSGLVLIRQPCHRDPADQHQNPGKQHRVPAIPPDTADIADQLIQ